MSITLGQARAHYANRADVKSPHTLQAYIRAIDLMLVYLSDRQFTPQLPIQNQPAPTASEYSLEVLTLDDEALLKTFAQWLQTPSPSGNDKRPYAASTIELRVIGVQRWLEFMETQGWLPPAFSVERAAQLYKSESAPIIKEEKPDKSVEVPDDLSNLINYYDHQRPSKAIRQNAERYQRWELTRLRNRALLKTLAETGGQISAILSINTSAIDTLSDEITLQVIGKNEHPYPIYLKDSLTALRDYLEKREIPAEKRAQTPLFVSHDAKYDGSRMSRIIAWRIIQRAARAVGFPDISPHDLRHWRAQKLLEAGLTLEEVKERLGHRSMHTIRSYYGHMLEDETSETVED